MALMAYNRSADLEEHIGSSMVLPPHNRPRSPRMDEDKDSTLGNSYYDDSPLGSPNRDSFSEPAGEGSFRPDIGLTDKDLIDIETKDLNKKLKKANVSKERAKSIKAERRTLKNRGYASSCRIKREKEVERLEDEIRIMKNDVGLYEGEIKELAMRNADMKEWHMKMDDCMRAFEFKCNPSSPDAGYLTDTDGSGAHTPGTPPAGAAPGSDHAIKDEEMDEEDTKPACIEHRPGEQCDCDK